MSGPSHWRVTLTWPTPEHWANPERAGYIGWSLRDPDHMASTFAMQLPTGALESISVGTRTVRIVATVPAQSPRRKHQPGGYASSAQIAVEWVIRAAQFGAGVINPRFPDSLDAPLPEPVRIKVESASAPECARPNSKAAAKASSQ